MARFVYTRDDDELVELYLAAEDLISAEALVSPAVNPNRFRQIAAAYEQMCAPQGNPCDSTPQIARQMNYLRFVASHLDDIDDADASGAALRP